MLWALLASALINTIAWVTLSAHVSMLRGAEQERPREKVVVTLSSIRVQHRPPARPIVQRPKPVRQPPKIERRTRRIEAPQEESAMLAPPPPASLSLPGGWARQDFAFLGTTETAEWLDWSKSSQNAKWVPRVFLWRMNVEAGYMHRTSLEDVVARILTSLREDAKIHTNKAQRVCGGQRAGWFLSYVKSGDDPPLHFDETVFVAGDKVFRAIYIRAADQPEDPRTREALNTLCWP